MPSPLVPQRHAFTVTFSAKRRASSNCLRLPTLKVQQSFESSFLWGTYCQDSYQRPFADKLTSYTVQELSQEKENHFRFLYDDGLSFVCRESRAIVLKDIKEHLKNNNSAPKKAQMVTAQHASETVQLNASSVIKLEFSPFYLQVHGNLPYKEFASNISFLRQPQLKQIDIAFDFDSRQELWNRFYRCDKLGNSGNHIQDHSIRGVIIRAAQAWAMGELPEKTRIFLIDRKETTPLVKQPYWLDWQYQKTLGTVVLADEEYDYVAAVGFGTDRFLRMVRNCLRPHEACGQLCLMPVIPVRKGEELVSADVAANWRRT